MIMLLVRGARLTFTYLNCVFVSVNDAHAYIARQKLSPSRMVYVAAHNSQRVLLDV